jgi:hypothetical protein
MTQSRPSPLLARFAALSFLALLGACQTPQKSFVHGDWSEFARVNPNDVAVSKVKGEDVPSEVSLTELRDSLRTFLLDHRYSPLSFAYVDASTGSKVGDVRVDLVIKKFDVQRYEMSRTMRVAGEFIFRTGEGSSEKVLAPITSDQVIDLSDSYRLGVSQTDAIRTAGRKFIEVSLSGMPDRKIDAK